MRIWPAVVENRLAEKLCREAEGDQFRGGVCGEHLFLARVALTHLAKEGHLKPFHPAVRTS